MVDKVQIFDLPPPGEESQTLFDPPSEQTAVTASPEQTKMTSTLAGFAQGLNDLSTENMSTLQQVYETRLNEGHEAEVRAEFARSQTDRHVADLQKLQSEALRVNPKDYSMSDAVQAEIATRVEQPNSAALEEDGTRVMSSAQADGDHSALAAYTGGSRTEQVAYGAKVAIYNAEMDKLKTAVQSEGTLEKAADFVFDYSGFKDVLTLSHVIKGQGTYFKFPSTNINDQSRFLWSQTPAGFHDYLTQAIEHGKSLWGAGPTYDALRLFSGPNIGTIGQSALGYNFWTYAGPASYIPVAKMARYASGLARVVGNRGLSVNITTAGLMSSASGIPSGMSHVQPIEASIAETIPSVSVPDTLSLARADVGVVSDVADRLEAIQKSTSEVLSHVSRTERVQPEQVREMVEKGVREAESQYRDSPVADIKREITEPNIFAAKFGPPEKPFVQVQPIGAKEFQSAGVPLAEKLRDNLHEKGFARFDRETADRIIGEPLYADETDTGEHGFSVSEADRIIGNHIYLDEFDVEHLAALNEEGELRPATARVVERGQSKVRFEVDNDTDIDTMSHWNSRGEIYHEAPEATNPFIEEQAKEGLGSGFLNMLEKAGKTQRLRVARKMPDGSVKIGKPGQIHSDLFDGEGPEDHWDHTPEELKAMGFADSSGKFYTREEAAAAIGKPNSLLESTGHQQAEGQNAVTHAGEAETATLGGIRSIPEVVKSPTTGLYSLKFYVGKDQATGGFLTAEGAAAAAIRRGFLNPKVIQTLDGQWYVETTHVLPETGLASAVVRPEDFPAVYRASEFIKSLDGLSAELHNHARIGAVLSKGKFLTEVVGPWAKNIKRLNPRQTKVLSSVLKSGEAEHTWFSMAELNDKYNQVAGRLPSDKEVMAYYSSKELSDLAYHVFNDRLYIPMAREGFETITVTNPAIKLDTGRMNARVIPPDAAKGENIFVVDDGSVSHGIRKDIQVLIDGGRYKMIELRQSRLIDGRPVKYMLAHTDSFVREPLERMQLTYNPGGSREYASKWFAKQANSVVDPDGHRTWLDPLTHVTGPTRSSLESWTDGMNRALDAYTDLAMSEVEKRLIVDASPIESYDKLHDMIESGKISPEHPFETLFDNQLPEAYTRVGLNDSNWTNPALRGEESYYQTQARMYYGEKGERLTDPSGAYAKTVNPLKTLRRAVYNAANTRALGDYNTKVIEDWAKAAGPYIDHRTVSLNANPWEVFFNGKFIKGISPEKDRLVSSMDIARNAHKRFMGMRDLNQTTKSLYLKKLGLDLEAKGANKAAEAVYSRLNADPVGAVRDLVFHGYFGFLNLRRFVLHASQAIGAIAVDPLRGLNAAGMAPITAALVHINRGDKLLEYMASKMSGSLGMSVDNYKQMVQSLRYSGWLNIGGEVAQLDRYADRWGGNMLLKGWDFTKEWGVAPFHAAIGLQRLMAYHMAWGMAKELMPSESVWGAKFQGFVNSKADVLSGSMTTASSAAWQKGVWGIPTQFMSWQARMFENLLPQTFGGSKALSQGQKLRYVLGQAALWGTSGVPIFGAGYDIISEMYRQNTGTQIDADTHRAITKGLVDSVIHGFTGADTDMAGEAGLGSAFNRTIEGFKSGDYNPFLMTLGGPAFDTGSIAYDKLSHFVTYMKAEQTDGITAAEFKMTLQDAAPLIQSLKFYQKAYWAYKWHAIYDQKTGQPIIDDATTADAVAAAVGVPNIWESIKGPQYQKQQEIEETINDVAKIIVKLRREQDDAINRKDYEKADAVDRIVRVVTQPYRDRPLMLQQIARRTTELSTRGYTDTEKSQMIQRAIKNTGYPPAEANPADQSVPTTPTGEQ